MKAIKISVIVQSTHEIIVREALNKVGAGTIGNYKNCQFILRGEAQFEPTSGADPTIGETGSIDVVEAVQIQTWCQESELEKILEAIRLAHPNEEPAIEVFPFEIR